MMAVPIICFQPNASLKIKYEANSNPIIVSEKNKALAIFNGMVFNASVIHTELSKPNTKAPANVNHFLVGLPKTIAAYLNPILVNILEIIANHIQKFVSIIF